jgi:hypothetical protein
VRIRTDGVAGVGLLVCAKIDRTKCFIDETGIAVLLFSLGPAALVDAGMFSVAVLLVAPADSKCSQTNYYNCGFWFVFAKSKNPYSCVRPARVSRPHPAILGVSLLLQDTSTTTLNAGAMSSSGKSRSGYKTLKVCLPCGSLYSFYYVKPHLPKRKEVRSLWLPTKGKLRKEGH